MFRVSGAHTDLNAGNPFAPDIGAKVSGENFVRLVGRPVPPPQLLADFAPLIAVLKRFGGTGAQHDSALDGGIGDVMAGLGVGLCFHG